MVGEVNDCFMLEWWLGNSAPVQAVWYMTEDEATRGWKGTMASENPEYHCVLYSVHLKEIKRWPEK